MPTRDGTGEFLARARVRARAAAALRVFALAAALLVFVLLGLAWAAHRIGPAAYWPTVTTGVLLAVTLGAAFFGVFRPWRRLKSDTAIARLVGVRHPPLASDLLSAVQLEGLVSPGEAPASQALVKAFRDQVAGAVAHLDLRQVVPFRPAQRAMGLAAGAALVLAVGIWLSPEGLLHGLGLLTRTPTLYEGAAVSDEPLVGDLVLTYHYPAYTGLPPRTVEGATGDVQALRGTRIDLDMRPLRDARRALLFFGENGERGPLEVAIVDGHLRASFVVAEADRYRVWLAPLLGRPVRERLGHRVEAAADQPPTVDIKAPADRLELPAPRPIEVGFAATDDYGLGLVELVYRVGGGPEKRITLQDGAGSRQAQGTTTWDPSSEALVPGVQIAYRLDAHDTDTVSGPKVGSSRTLFLVLEHPRESSDESLESQRYVLERLIGVLADRLEATDGSRSEVKSRSPLQEWQAFQTAHEDETAQVALLAGLVDEQRREGGASEGLLEALSKIADRLNRELRHESAALQKLRPQVDQGRGESLDLGPLRRLAPDHVATLEDVVLVLDDLIGRQRLEDLAGLGEQLTQAYERLADLLERYQNTKDEALREQLQREIQALQRRMAEMAQKIEAVKARNEVGTEWQNMPDMSEAMSKAQTMQDLLDKGDSASLSQALAELGDTLQSLKQMLSQNADDFTGDRFPKESRAQAELTKKMAELEGDERQLAADTGELAKELQQAMQDRQRKEVAARMQALNDKLERLRSELRQPVPRRLGEQAAENQAQAQARATSAKQLLSQEDVVQARKEMDDLSQALNPLARQAQARAAKEQPGGTIARFAERMTGAQQLAQEITNELAQLTPAGGQVASPAQRQRAEQMGERQRAIADRTRALASEAQEGGGTPGLSDAAKGLEDVAGQMQKALGDLQRGNAAEAEANEKAAADRLAQLRDGLKGEKMARGSRSQEPVRIPGADDSKAPKAWRQELMEAMKEKGPEPFRDAVRRYYEELVK